MVQREAMGPTNEAYNYKEDIELAFDGETLSVSGRNPVFGSEIPAEEETRAELVGGAISDAFDNPLMTIIAPYNPRKFY